MKKRVRFVILLALVLLAVSVCTAQADEPLPAAISSYFSGDAYAGASITDTARWGSGWFVLVRTGGGENVLYCFTASDGKWVNSFSTSKAIPQGSHTVEIYVTNSIAEFSAQEHFDGQFLVISQYNDEQGYLELFSAYQLSSSGQWNLIRIISKDSRGAIAIGNGTVTYYKDLNQSGVIGTVQGKFQRDLRYISLSAFPKTYQKAQQHLTTPPVLPEDSELTAQEFRFTGGRKYPVYSAPDKLSLRGGNGKAQVSTNGWIQVFGKENGWILIQYSIDKNHYRFGYIDAASLPKKANAADLDFQRISAVANEKVSVTDDPLFSRSTLTALSEGDPVTLLSIMGEWAYIEGSGFRGFVPYTSLAFPSAAGGGYSIYTGSSGAQYDLFEIRKLLYDKDHHVYAVTGVYERVATDEEGIYYVDTAEESLVTYNLADNFHADMQSPSGPDPDAFEPVTDLYAWYINAYLEGKAPVGRELIFSCDLTDEQNETTDVDFWFVTTQIRLNEKNEIEYMRYHYVPWA